MELLLLYVFLTLSLSFLCSILEAVLLSINTTFIKIKLKEGKVYAKKLLNLKNSIDEPLIIILTLNTIAHTVGAILVGVQAKVAYSELDYENTFLAGGDSDEILVGFVSTVMTVLILLFSEIIPKTIEFEDEFNFFKPSTYRIGLKNIENNSLYFKNININLK